MSICKINQSIATPDFIVICGPTASGKTRIGIEVAKALNGEIVCCDSVQIYKGFDLGSAKPTLEEMQQVPHHLFGVFDWHENCDAAIFAAKAKEIISEIKGRGRIPIIVGGTGLYLRALLGDKWDDDIPSDPVLRTKLNLRTNEELYSELQRLDPRRARELHVNDRFRVARALEINLLTGAPVPEVKKSPSTNKKHLVIKIEIPREELNQRILARTSDLISAGLVREVECMLAQGVSEDCKPMSSIGYKETRAFLRGELNLKQLAEQISTSTRQYAKRQVTWFNKVEADLIVNHLDGLGELIKSLKVLI